MEKIKHFKMEEFWCKCGQCRVQLLDRKLPALLDTLRDQLGKPIHITSAYRCPEHNRAVGGVPSSQHTKGTAADIQVAGVKPVEIARLAEKLGFTGIGIYDTFTHLDVRETPARWDRRS